MQSLAENFDAKILPRRRRNSYSDLSDVEEHSSEVILADVTKILGIRRAAGDAMQLRKIQMELAG